MMNFNNENIGSAMEYLKGLDEKSAMIKNFNNFNIANESSAYNTTSQRTVWTDLAAELRSCTPEEEMFISQDSEYLNSANVQKTAFYSFIENKFKEEFLRYDTNNTSEKTLMSLKGARQRYREEAKAKEEKNKEIFDQYAKMSKLMEDPEVAELLKRKVGSNKNK